MHERGCCLSAREGLLFECTRGVVVGLILDFALLSSLLVYPDLPPPLLPMKFCSISLYNLGPLYCRHSGHFPWKLLQTYIHAH